ncbi:unnamed protein product [Clonostachys byssicola]|uniref:RRM domain-containing protein n=1 Tax=Clonostachys byssicola TaxID=160290 RepID=A0A9N9TX78_9HYPO|nr:unnamed protein product [Clonostachys byssicola]
MASSSKMDRGLDEIIADNRSNAPRNRRNGGGPTGRRRGGDRQETPRDGVRKVREETPPGAPSASCISVMFVSNMLHLGCTFLPLASLLVGAGTSSFTTSRSVLGASYRNEPRNLDGEWVHDRYEENSYRKAPAPRRRQASPEAEAPGSKLRVENIHYDLTQDDLEELFKRIGPVTKLQLRYDRAGRSDGVAFVTYETKADAEQAIREFDGANANGQPIRLTLLSERRGRNPFDSAYMPGRPLSERITAPDGRARSQSPQGRYLREDAARRGIDRYIPGEGSGNRSRSPAPRRGGRRPGARREPGQGRGREGGREARGNPRSKKTQEELDAEMADYFGGNGDAAPEAAQGNGDADTTQNAAQAAQVPAEDIDMIE